jgi:hypothetical protein
MDVPIRLEAREAGPDATKSTHPRIVSSAARQNLGHACAGEPVSEVRPTGLVLGVQTRSHSNGLDKNLALLS